MNNKNDILDRIIKTEINFPKTFSNTVEKDYGILFYNENNKTSHDSNHGVLFYNKIDCINDVLNDVFEFYTKKGIVPRVYHSFENGSYDKYKDIFIDCGYEIERYDNCQYMILSSDNIIKANNQLLIKRVTCWDEEIANIFIENNTEYTIPVLKDAIKSENFHLYVGYLGENAVTSASLYYSEYETIRVDNVETRKKFRGEGYCRELISYVVDNNKSIDKVFYLWTENNTARKIYQEAGFKLMSERFEYWGAFKKNL